MRSVANNPDAGLLEKDFKEILPFVGDLKTLEGTRWLITGGTGMMFSYMAAFLGWLNEFLASPMDIVVTSRRELVSQDPAMGMLSGRKGITVKKIDFAGEFCLSGEDVFDYVIHGATSAAPKSYLKDSIGTINANVRGLQLLLEHFRKTDRLRAFLYVSSGEIYGEVASENVPVPESYCGSTNHLSERSCYVESKRFGETLCNNYFRAYGLPVKIVRPVQIFGPGFCEGDSRAWADFLEKAYLQKPIEVLSDGSSRRAYCYQVDAVAQILRVLRVGECGEAYNIGNENHISIKELAELIAKLSDPAVKVVIKNQTPDYLQGSPQISCPAIGKVRGLGALPETSIEEGLRRTYEWFSAVKERL